MKLQMNSVVLRKKHTQTLDDFIYMGQCTGYRRAVKVQGSLHICTDLPEPQLLQFTIRFDYTYGSIGFHIFYSYNCQSQCYHVLLESISKLHLNFQCTIV